MNNPTVKRLAAANLSPTVLDSSSTTHADMVLSKIKSSKKAQAAKGFLEKNVPIPAHFYAGKTDEDLMAPKRASRRKSIFFFFTFSCECAR